MSREIMSDILLKAFLLLDFDETYQRTSWTYVETTLHTSEYTRKQETNISVTAEDTSHVIGAARKSANCW